jgi:predicted Rossmann fold flavoprotein
LELRLYLRNQNNQLLAEQTGSTLFTHFGISGPTPMNLSRHIARHKLETGHMPRLYMSNPDFKDEQEADKWLLKLIAENPKRSAAAAINLLFPDRLAQLLAQDFPQLGALTRDQRRELARRISALPLPVTGDRGYTFAEATAGGVDLREVDIRTMQSRIVPNLFLCGEVLDVDGRIGGFNFQWAWSSGYLAGRGAAKAALASK